MMREYDLIMTNQFKYKDSLDSKTKYHIAGKSLLAMLLFFALLPAIENRAEAHPMGNFSINHYARIELRSREIKILFLLDFAEIPTVSLKSEEDANGDGTISELEKKIFLEREAKKIASGISLSLNGKPVELKSGEITQEFRPGAGGLPTMRLSQKFSFSLPVSSSASSVVNYRDGNYSERTGWKEIIAIASSGLKFLRSSASTEDRSKELTVYPTDPGVVPPQQTEAEFEISEASSSKSPLINDPSNIPSNSGAVPPVVSKSQVAPATSTPQDAFTQAISKKELGLGVILTSLGLAFLFGAFHALSPGHGKAMVAAYLVGSRGTLKHALFLGGVVTITHTIGVFLLGIITLGAAQYVVPEKFYPILSGLSGLLIVIVGATLLWQRLQALREGEAEEGEEEEQHNPLPENAQVSLKSLLVLGVTGGIIPCPSALVVMLSAVALHRIAFGLCLIIAFSLGLAAVLTAIGMLIVKLKGSLQRLPIQGKILAKLPIFSAGLVTLVGLILLIRSFSGKF